MLYELKRRWAIVLVALKLLSSACDLTTSTAPPVEMKTTYIDAVTER